jgi:hypothetical protein
MCLNAVRDGIHLILEQRNGFDFDSFCGSLSVLYRRDLAVKCRNFRPAAPSDTACANCSISIADAAYTDSGTITIKSTAYADCCDTISVPRGIAYGLS